MGFIKRTHKKFDYKPRYYGGEGNPYQFEHKFDKFRTTVGKRKSIKQKLNAALDEFKNPELKDKKVDRIILIIVAILVLLFMYFIDFDFSIFISK